jgi:Flp pilus assembly pilin Flp
LKRITKTVRGLVQDQSGASLAEYAILLALVAIICLAAMAQFGSTVNGFFSSFASTI